MTGSRLVVSWASMLVLVSLAQSAPAAPEIPRTEEAAACAARIVERLNASHYQLKGTKAPGCVATFRVHMDGTDIGPLTVTWNRSTNSVRTVFKGEAKADVRARAELLSFLALRLALVEDWDAKDCFAVEAGDEVVMDATAHYDLDEKKHLDYIAKDLLAWRHTIHNADGSEVRESCTYTAVGDKAFISRLDRAKKWPDKPREKAVTTYKYLRRDGNPFVKRLTIEESRGALTTKWRFEFADLGWRALPDVNAKSADARLAEEVIGRIEKRHYSLLTEDVTGFTAQFVLTDGGTNMGSVRCRWTKKTGNLQVDFEGRLTSARAKNFLAANGETYDTWAEREVWFWVTDAVLLGFGTNSSFTARAKTTKDGIVLLQEDPSGVGAVREIITIISREGEVRSVEHRRRSGQNTLTAFGHGEVDGKFLKRRASLTVREKDGTLWERTTRFTYSRESGHVFLKRVRVQDGGGVGGANPSSRELEMRKVVFTK